MYTLGCVIVCITVSIVAISFIFSHVLRPEFVVHDKGIILITGTSSGIGRDAALTFDKLGYIVFGGVRKIADAAKLKSETSSRFHPIILDVTNPDHIAKAFDTISKRPEPLVGLINNAGVNIGPSPVSLFPDSYVRKTFEVNFFGLLEMTQTFTPLLMESKGRIIHITSVAGFLSFPLIGIYSASKFAVEAIADAQRLELKEHGVAVILVEPGVVITRLTENLHNNPVWDAVCESNANATIHFGWLWDCFLKQYPSAMSIAATVTDTSNAIVEAFVSPKPYTRYLVGYDAKGFALLKSIVPYTVFDFIWSNMFCSDIIGMFVSEDTIANSPTPIESQNEL